FVVSVPHRERRGGPSPRRRGDRRLARDRERPPVRLARLARYGDRRVQRVFGSRGPRAGARAARELLARRGVPQRRWLVRPSRDRRARRLLLRLLARREVRELPAREPAHRPRYGGVQRLAVGAQPARRGVRGARLLLRQRAARLSEQALYPPRRSAAL